MAKKIDDWGDGDEFFSLNGDFSDLEDFSFDGESGGKSDSFFRNVSKSAKNFAVAAGKAYIPDFMDLKDSAGMMKMSVSMGISDMRERAVETLAKNKLKNSGGVNIDPKSIAKELYTTGMERLKSGKWFNDPNAVDFNFDDDDDDWGDDDDEESESIDKDEVPKKKKGKVRKGIYKPIKLKLGGLTAEQLMEVENQQTIAQTKVQYGIYKRQALRAEQHFGAQINIMKNIAINVHLIAKIMSKENIKGIISGMEFQKKSLALQMDQMGILKEMRNAQMRLAGGRKKGDKYVDDTSAFERIAGFGFDPSAYIDNVKSNAKEFFDSSMVGQVKSMMDMQKEMSGMMGGKKKGPLSDIMGYAKMGGSVVIDSLLPPQLKLAMENISKASKSLPALALSKLNALGETADGPLGWIGQILGTQNYEARGIDVGLKDPRKPTPFDEKTHKAITSVIPGYLSKIVSALTGAPETYFDYSANNFKTSSSMRLKSERTIKESLFSTEEISGVRNSFTADISRRNATSKNKVSPSDLSKGIDTFMENMVRNRYEMHPNVVAYNSDTVFKNVNPLVKNLIMEMMLDPTATLQLKSQFQQYNSTKDVVANNLQKVQKELSQHAVNFGGDLAYAEMNLDYANEDLETLIAEKDRKFKHLLKNPPPGRMGATMVKNAESELAHLRNQLKYKEDSFGVVREQKYSSLGSSGSNITFDSPAKGLENIYNLLLNGIIVYSQPMNKDAKKFLSRSVAGVQKRALDAIETEKSERVLAEESTQESIDTNARLLKEKREMLYQKGGSQFLSAFTDPLSDLVNKGLGVLGLDFMGVNLGKQEDDKLANAFKPGNYDQNVAKWELDLESLKNQQNDQKGLQKFLTGMKIWGNENKLKAAKSDLGKKVSNFDPNKAAATAESKVRGFFSDTFNKGKDKIIDTVGLEKYDSFLDKTKKKFNQAKDYLVENTYGTGMNKDDLEEFKKNNIENYNIDLASQTEEELLLPGMSTKGMSTKLSHSPVARGYVGDDKPGFFSFLKGSDKISSDDSRSSHDSLINPLNKMTSILDKSTKHVISIDGKIDKVVTAIDKIKIKIPKGYTAEKGALPKDAYKRLEKERRQFDKRVNKFNKYQSKLEKKQYKKQRKDLKRVKKGSKNKKKKKKPNLLWKTTKDIGKAGLGAAGLAARAGWGLAKTGAKGAWGLTKGAGRLVKHGAKGAWNLTGGLRRGLFGYTDEEGEKHKGLLSRGLGLAGRTATGALGLASRGIKGASRGLFGYTDEEGEKHKGLLSRGLGLAKKGTTGLWRGLFGHADEDGVEHKGLFSRAAGLIKKPFTAIGAAIGLKGLNSNKEKREKIDFSKLTQKDATIHMLKILDTWDRQGGIGRGGGIIGTLLGGTLGLLGLPVKGLKFAGGKLKDFGKKLVGVPGKIKEGAIKAKDTVVSKMSAKKQQKEREKKEKKKKKENERKASKKVQADSAAALGIMATVFGKWDKDGMPVKGGVGDGKSRGGLLAKVGGALRFGATALTAAATANFVRGGVQSIEKFKEAKQLKDAGAGGAEVAAHALGGRGSSSYDAEGNKIEKSYMQSVKDNSSISKVGQAAAGLKIITKIGKFLTKFLSDPKVLKFIPGKFVANIVQTVLTKLGKTAIGTFAAKIGASLMKAAQPVGWAMIIYDFLSGMKYANRYFKLPKGASPNGIMRAVSGIVNVLSGLLFGLLPPEIIAPLLYNLIAKESTKNAIKDAQKFGDARARLMGISDGNRLMEYETKTLSEAIGGASKSANILGFGRGKENIKRFKEWNDNVYKPSTDLMKRIANQYGGLSKLSKLNGNAEDMETQKLFRVRYLVHLKNFIEKGNLKIYFPGYKDKEDENKDSGELGEDEEGAENEESRGNVDLDNDVPGVATGSVSSEEKPEGLIAVDMSKATLKDKTGTEIGGSSESGNVRIVPTAGAFAQQMFAQAQTNANATINKQAQSNGSAAASKTNDEEEITPLDIIAQYSELTYQELVKLNEVTTLSAMMASGIKGIGKFGKFAAQKYKQAGQKAYSGIMSGVGYTGKKAKQLAKLAKGKFGPIVGKFASPTGFGALKNAAGHVYNALARKGEDGVRITQLSGPRFPIIGGVEHPEKGMTQTHKGIDIGSPNWMKDPPLYAISDGVVSNITDSSTGFGKSVAIDHGKGLISLYGHLDQFGVEEGQQVKKGQPIGIMGSTGNSTAPHLHLQMTKDGKLIDPEAYISRGKFKPIIDAKTGGVATNDAEKLMVAYKGKKAESEAGGKEGKLSTPPGQDAAIKFNNEVKEGLEILNKIHEEQLRHNKISEEFFVGSLTLMAQIAAGNTSLSQKLASNIRTPSSFANLSEGR